MNTVEIGRILENKVIDKLNSIGIKAKRTKGSGNKGQAGDVQNDILVIECKQINKKNITIKEDVWRKLCNEIPLHSKRKPVYVLGNANNRSWCVVDTDTFFELLEGYIKNEEKKDSRPE